MKFRIFKLHQNDKKSTNAKQGPGDDNRFSTPTLFQSISRRRVFLGFWASIIKIVVDAQSLRPRSEISIIIDHFGSLCGGLFDEATKYRVSMTLNVQVEKKPKEEPNPSQPKEEKPRHGGPPSPIEVGNAFKATLPLVSALVSLFVVGALLWFLYSHRNLTPSWPPPQIILVHRYYHVAGQPPPHDVDGKKPPDGDQDQPLGGKKRLDAKEGSNEDGNEGDNGEK